MKISVIIPSRKRTRKLTALLLTLHNLSSGDNSILYGVCCDDDDTGTQMYCKHLQAEKFPLSYLIGPRPQSLGGLDNVMATHMPADVYCVLGDDMLCITPDWDKVIVDAVQKTPHGVFWWSNKDGSLTTCPIITERWRAAAGGLFTDYFPFWYDDLWLYELWVMATDQEAIILPIVMFDRPESTIRMRELRFWQEFYHRMRGERVKHAEEIAEKLGLPKPVFGPHLVEKLRDATGMTEEMEADIHRRNKAESTPPDESYNRAKERAMALMAA